MELDLAAKELSLKREDIRPLEVISIIIIKLLPIEQVIYQMLELDQPSRQCIQHDEILSFKIKINKCHEIVALESSTVMLIHHNYDYSVIRLKKQKCQIITFGKLCGLCQNIKKFGRTQIIYVFDQTIHVYDWISKEIVHLFSFQSTLSAIYLKLANYCIDDQYLLIWKQSSLKLQFQYYYQIELYSRNGMVLIKKWRIEKPCAHNIALLRNPTPLPILCPTQGYNLLISIPDLNLAHQIKSIYKLLLTQIISHPYDKSQVQLNFTHNELIAGTRLCYNVSTDAIRKTYKQQQDEDEDFVSWQKFEEGDARYEIGVKDWVGSYGQRDGVEVKLKARYGRKVKMCAMLECVMESEVGKFSADLLMQMCSMIE